MSLVLRDALLATGDRADVRIRGGVVSEVASGLAVGGDDEVHDLDGALLLPALCEPHAHLDKAFLADLVANPTGDLLGAVDSMRAVRELMTRENTIDRSRRAAELLIRNGATAIRTHSDVAELNGVTSVEALVSVADELSGSALIEIVALVSAPVCGPAGRENMARLRDALDAGAHLVGGAPQLEGDVAGAVRTLVDIAAERGVGIDLHLDETLDPHVLGLADLADYVLATGFPHPVSASHCVSLGVLPPEQQRRIAERVCEAGISSSPTRTPTSTSRVASIRPPRHVA